MEYHSKDNNGEERKEELDNDPHWTPETVSGSNFVQKATLNDRVERASSCSSQERRTKKMLPTSSTVDVSGHVRSFRLTVDVYRLKDVALKEGHKYYLRYMYKYLLVRM